MSDWLTSRETAVLLGISSKNNLRQVTGFDTIKRKPGAPYNGYYYRRADVERELEPVYLPGGGKR